jgi:anti-sigma B factor antagonist
MNVTTRTDKNISIITVTGSIDSKSAGGLQAEILNNISEAGNVLMDLSNVDFVSSAGLRVLLMLYRQIRSKDGKIILAGVNEEIKDVMSMTGFIKFFEFSDEIDDAFVMLENYA